MTEKNLSIKKNGLAVLLLSLFIYAAGKIGDLEFDE